MKRIVARLIEKFAAVIKPPVSEQKSTVVLVLSQFVAWNFMGFRV
jgi:hypothetical protein